MNPLLDAALAYAARGWLVFPLHAVLNNGACSCGDPSCYSPPPGKSSGAGKHPRTANGLRDGTTDPATIRTWWHQYPDSNVGIVTGAVSGIWALDIDPRHAGDVSVENWGALPPSLHQQTGGGGSHWIYTHPGRPVRNRQNVLHGVDVRGDGGYIVAPPSIHWTGAVYCWEDEDELPDPLPAGEELLALVLSDASLSGHAAGIGSAPVTERRRIMSALASIPAENRDTWIRVGMSLRSLLGEDGFSVWDAWSATTTAGNYDGATQRRQWRSLKPGDGTASTTNEETLWYLARAHGWQDPSLDSSAALVGTETSPPERTGPELRAGPFPSEIMRPENMPGLLGRVHSWIVAGSIRPQPVLTLANVLAMLGALYGRRYGRETGLRTNLYVVGLAPSGAGKNDSRKAVKALLTCAGLQDLLGGESLASDAGITSALARSPAVLFQLDEFGQLLGRCFARGAKAHERGILSELLTLYSDAGSVRLGKERSTHGLTRPEDKRAQGRADILDPCAVLYGTSTPDAFWGALSEENISDGLLSRFLIFESETPRPPRNPNHRNLSDPPRELVDGVARIVDLSRETDPLAVSGLTDDGTTGSPCRMVPVSKEYLAAVYRAEAETDALGAALGYRGVWEVCQRTVENAERLALIRAVSRDPRDPTLQRDDFEWAYQLARWSANRIAERATDSIASNGHDADVNRVLRAIRGAGSNGLNKSQLARAFKGVRARDRNEILTTLEEAGLVTRLREPNTGGRPRETYFAVQV